MGLELYYSAFNPGSYSYSLQTYRDIINLKIDISYKAGTVISFSLLNNENFSTPIPMLGSVVLYNDGTPVFNGFVNSVTPNKDANTVDYVCFDATWMVNEQVTLLNTVGTDPDGVPYRVYNALPNDSDFSNCYNKTTYSSSGTNYVGFVSVGQIIEDILTDTYSDLVVLNACPSLLVGGDAFASSETSQLDFEPNKITFQSEGVTSAINRVLAYMPNWRWLYVAADNIWHFFKVTNSSTETLVLNDPTQTKLVLTLQLQRVIDGRRTAVEIYGPPNPVNGAVSLDTVTGPGVSAGVYNGVTIEAGGLVEDWTFGQETTFLSTGPTASGIDNVGYRWKVNTGYDKASANLMPVQMALPDEGSLGGAFLYYNTQELSFSFTFGETDAFGNEKWYTIVGATYDRQNGVVITPRRIFKGGDSGPWSLPTNAILWYAPYAAPHKVRYPTSGFAGTAYSQANCTNVEKLYVPDLIDGTINGYQVSTSDRITQFTNLAQYLHELKKDIVYAGSIVLNGIHWDYLTLNKRINITSSDAAGNTITTGLESVNMILSQVEYDFTNKQTILTFSNDVSEYYLQDIESAKVFLKIRAVQVQSVLNTAFVSADGNLTQSANTTYYSLPTQ